MISLLSLMWTTAVFFALTGALRGWRRELVGTTGIMLGFFAIFQFDSLLRGSLYLLLTDEQTFLLQTAALLGTAALAYRSRLAARADDGTGRIRNMAFGAAIGFFNGYLVAGSTWYFLDINRYPFSQLLSAPADASVSALGAGALPIVVLGGGLAGGGSSLAVAILAILAVVLLFL
ncbi:MAG: hypothetical protein OXG53_19205 [Chloroflexi bacterium]|nr:hypothetical protein [Chloroflexota bacterium]